MASTSVVPASHYLVSKADHLAWIQPIYAQSKYNTVILPRT